MIPTSSTSRPPNPTPRAVIIDDRLLVEAVLGRVSDLPAELYSTTYWYYRACRAAVLGAGGQLSGPLLGLDPEIQRRTTASLLRLPEHIGLPDPRDTVPAMAELARRHARLNLLNLEAVAMALLLDAVVWLSPAAGEGVLPSVLGQEGVAWERVEWG